MNDSTKYDVTISNLKERVSEYDPEIRYTSKMMPSIPIKYHPYIIYLIIPIIIFSLLIGIKPKFILEEKETEDGVQNKLLYSKIFITTILISAALGICIYIYFYKKKKLLTN